MPRPGRRGPSRGTRGVDAGDLRCPRAMRRVVRGLRGARSDPLPRSRRAPGHHLARGRTSAISGHPPKRRDALRSGLVVDQRDSRARTIGGFPLLCKDSRRAGPRGPARRLACGRSGYRTSGIGANPDRVASVSGLVVFGLIPVRGDGDRGHLTRHLLQAVLAADTGRNLRHRLQAGGRDGLSTLLAGAVVAAAQTLQRLGETVGALHEQAPGGEIHLAILVHLDHVDFVGELARIAHGTMALHGGGGPAQLADALHGPVQFGFQFLLDLVHSLSPSLWAVTPASIPLIRLAEGGCKACAATSELRDGRKGQIFGAQLGPISAKPGKLLPRSRKNVTRTAKIWRSGSQNSLDQAVRVGVTEGPGAGVRCPGACRDQCSSWIRMWRVSLKKRPPMTTLMMDTMIGYQSP